MEFEWDEVKNQRNIRKHGISFETAALVFTDPLHVSIQDRVENGEQRWQTLGVVQDHTVLLVAHLVVNEDGTEIIRLISARKAELKERKLYEQENQYY